jgi:sphingosine kinase
MVMQNPIPTRMNIAVAEVSLTWDSQAQHLRRIHRQPPKATVRLSSRTIEPIGSCSLAHINSDIPTEDKAQFIPLYNVLWAESSDGVLTVDYVRVTKNHVKLQKIRLPLNKTETEANNEPDPESLAATILAKAYQGTKLRKRVMVLVNPHAGPGGAVKRWTQEVKPLFRAARLEMEVIILTRGGEATDLVEKMDIDKFDAVIPCSGDGTPHEVFNGLGKRKDAQEALRKIAVGLIPCGSGNALSWNLYGSNKADVAALSIIKGVVMPIDLTSITQGSTRMLSFLSQAVGIIAESDLATEHLRWMGATRFEVGLVMRVFQRKCYPCDLAVKVEVEDKARVKAHYKRHIQSEALAETNGVSEEHVEGLPALKYGTVEDKLPEGWELVPQDKIGNFYCGNVSISSSSDSFG